MTPADVKAAAAYLNSGKAWRVLNCRGDFPRRTQGTWLQTEYGNVDIHPYTSKYIDDTELLALAKREGWEGEA